MATSASDRLKAMLAAQLNKKANNENQPANQATQPQVSVAKEIHQQRPEESLVSSVDVEDKKANESVGSGSLVVIEETKQEIALAEAPVPKEDSQTSEALENSERGMVCGSVSVGSDQAKSAFFDTPLGRMMNDLEVALNEKLPGMPSILRDIHLHMQKDVDCVTQLSEEEIGTIVRGLESVQGQTIVANPKTGRSTGGKKAPVVASML